MSPVDELMSENPELAEILDQYREVQEAYKEAAAAIHSQPSLPSVANSAVASIKVTDGSDIRF